MEREQRSEGLLRDFIRANCQRMKHELANRDCRLGRYRRDPGAAAAVTPPQLLSRRVKWTHAITPLTHAVSPLTGQIWSWRCQRSQIQTLRYLKIRPCSHVSLPELLVLTGIIPHVLEK